MFSENGLSPFVLTVRRVVPQHLRADEIVISPWRTRRVWVTCQLDGWTSPRVRSATRRSERIKYFHKHRCREHWTDRRVTVIEVVRRRTLLSCGSRWKKNITRLFIFKEILLLVMRLKLSIFHYAVFKLLITFSISNHTLVNVKNHSTMWRST